MFWQVEKLFWQGRWENYFSRACGKIILGGAKNILAGQVGKLFYQVGEFILSDWSPPDDPARVLAAEGSLNPSVCNRTV